MRLEEGQKAGEDKKEKGEGVEANEKYSAKGGKHNASCFLKQNGKNTTK